MIQTRIVFHFNYFLSGGAFFIVHHLALAPRALRLVPEVCPISLKRHLGQRGIGQRRPESGGREPGFGYPGVLNPSTLATS